MVEDDGPGIPNHEIKLIERVGETPLVHGSGVGLWAVKWCVERLDGTLTIESNGSRGTVMNLQLPDLELRE